MSLNNRKMQSVMQDQSFLTSMSPWPFISWIILTTKWLLEGISKV
jgi:hypothetical protein